MRQNVIQCYQCRGEGSELYYLVDVIHGDMMSREIQCNNVCVNERIMIA